MVLKNERISVCPPCELDDGIWRLSSFALACLWDAAFLTCWFICLVSDDPVQPGHHLHITLSLTGSINSGWFTSETSSLSYLLKIVAMLLFGSVGISSSSTGWDFLCVESKCT